jgi:cytochrome c
MAAWVLLVASTARTQDKGGADLFLRRCGGCHAMDRDKMGPNLKGVYGRAAASLASFPYSDALKKSGITWNAETLDKWLTDPEKLVPGNDMTFHVESAAERAAIIAYLKESSGRTAAELRSQSTVTVVPSANVVRSLRRP